MKPLKLGLFGPSCPRCGNVSEVRQHKAITAKELRRPFYYREWYYCINRQCKTTMFVNNEHRVWNDNASAEQLQRMNAIRAQLYMPIDEADDAVPF